MLNKSIKTILVGVDFFPYSKIVLRQAKILRDFFNSDLVLVHAQQEPIVFANGYPYAPVPRMTTQDLVQQCLDYYGPQEQVQYIVGYGLPAKILIKTAKRFDQPLIVVGYKGHSNLTEFLFGTTTQSLMMKSNIPVWIHRGHKVRSIQNLLVAHDLTDRSSQSIRLIKNMKKIKPFRYQVYSVKNKPFPILDVKQYMKMQRKLEQSARKGVKNLKGQFRDLPIVLEYGDVTKQIVRKSKDFDALVMTQYHKPGLFNRGYTSTILKKINIPLLVVH